MVLIQSAIIKAKKISFEIDVSEVVSMSVTRRVLSLCAAAMISLFLCGCEKKDEVVDLKESDKINELSYLDDSGKKQKFDISDETYVFYMSELCSGCMAELPIIESINKIGGDKVNIALIFSENIPHDKIDNYDLCNIDMYGLNEMNGFSATMPYYYIVENNIVKKATERSEDIFDEILSKIGDKEDLEKEFYELFMLKYSNKKCIIFIDDEYKGTDASEAVLVSNRKTSFYEYDIQDVQNFYQNLFGIESFPAKVILKNGKIVVS